MSLGEAPKQLDLLDAVTRFCDESLPEGSIYGFLFRERDRLFAAIGRRSVRGCGCTAGKWGDMRRRLIGPGGRWRRPTTDGIELFNIASTRATRYRYRGVKIPNPWNQLNHD